jgi:hypothetical protein
MLLFISQKLHVSSEGILEVIPILKTAIGHSSQETL